jgi:hypothetical protein
MENEESAIIIEYELSEDLIDSYTNNKDITFVDLNVKKGVECFPIGTLLQVTKKIGSFTQILSAKEVNDSLVSSILGD